MEETENKEISNVDSTQKEEIKQVEETPEQINWKKFRTERERERKEKETAERIAQEKSKEAEALKAAMEALINKPDHRNSISNQDNYDNEEVSEDERINKKVEAALLVRERKLEDERRKREHSEMPQRLASTYKDFEKVCSPENLDYFMFHYPEVAAPYKSLPDTFENWSNIYHAIKRFVPNLDTKKDQAKVEKNSNKPQSMSVGGSTQTGDSAPYMLDEKKKASNWARMEKIRKSG